MIARFDPDGLAWLVVSLFRLLVSLLRAGAATVGTVVIVLVLCGLVYVAVAAVRRQLAGEPAKQDFADASRQLPSTPSGSEK
jgi:hypothetical protein